MPLDLFWRRDEKNKQRVVISMWRFRSRFACSINLSLALSVLTKPRPSPWCAATHTGELRHHTSNTFLSVRGRRSAVPYNLCSWTTSQIYARCYRPGQSRSPIFRTRVRLGYGLGLQFSKVIKKPGRLRIFLRSSPVVTSMSIFESSCSNHLSIYLCIASTKTHRISSSPVGIRIAVDNSKATRSKFWVLLKS